MEPLLRWYNEWESNRAKIICHKGWFRLIRMPFLIFKMSVFYVWDFLNGWKIIGNTLILFYFLLKTKVTCVWSLVL